MAIEDPLAEGPVTRTFLEALFRELREDFAALRRDVASDVKAIKKDLGELGQRVDSLERAGEWREEELSAHSKELLEFRDKNEGLLLRLEEHENHSRHSNIRIRGAPLQADAGKFEDYILQFFRQVVPALEEESVILDLTQRVGRPSKCLRTSLRASLLSAKGP
ncbi:hypothetical protein NDU88_003663 [Pleurodeles waltl]|uniref:Uncharacterized protein n=1 Tax=Pleurodeles waltl TaxID=8319 RepID=A0AAV7T5B2_PLEWA|nr:hypothetical protein NDU88_003663 [Pleurodeles waltl]